MPPKRCQPQKKEDKKKDDVKPKKQEKEEKKEEKEEKKTETRSTRSKKEIKPEVKTETKETKPKAAAETKPKRGAGKRKAEDPKPETNGDDNAKEEEKVEHKEKKAKVEKKESQSKLTTFVTVQKVLDLGDGVFNTSPIKISSWNVNGLRAVMGRGEVLSYLKKANPDILCLNETKVSEKDLQSDPKLSKIHEDYFHYYNCSKDKQGYSGTAILTKVKPISVTFDIGTAKHDGEGRTITAEFEKFNLVACYVPNAGQKLDRLGYRTKEWDPDFRKYLGELRAKKPTILCGDLNVAHQEIDIHDPKGNKRSAGFTVEERESFTTFLNEGWIDTFRHLNPAKVLYTYFSMRTKAREKNAGWRLDYFVINKDHMKAVKDSTADGAAIGSDHIPIELSLDVAAL